MRDDSAEIPFETFLREASTVSSSGTGRDVHPLALSTQHFVRTSRDVSLSFGSCEAQ